MIHSIETEAISSGYDRKTCWVHTRPAAIPTRPETVVVTLQKLDLKGDDVFHAIHDMRTDDGGATWHGPVAHEQTLGRRPLEGGIIEGISDFTPAYHTASQRLLGTGHTVMYCGEALTPLPRPRSTVYSVYDDAARTWAPWRKLELPEGEKFASEGAGSTQRLDLPNGEILLPTYFSVKETLRDEFYIENVATVLRCSFDGETLRYLEHGSELTLAEGRGLVEPSIATVGGRFFLTLRNDLAGYITTSTDGLHYDPPRRWLFDDGSDLGNYNTQQHWVTDRDDLYLVYTRRGAGNDHIMRHRAPLFIAQVDTERLCVIRETERILVPERGARLCNFGVTKISERESWVSVAEWMQTKLPDPFDSTLCERYGSDNSIYVAKIRFQ